MKTQVLIYMSICLHKIVSFLNTTKNKLLKYIPCLFPNKIMQAATSD